jgi:hypothetical protein
VTTYSPHDQPVIKLRPEINIALTLLKSVGLKTAQVEADLEQLTSDVMRVPTQDDLRWPLSPPEEIGAHLSLGSDRPILDCKLVRGRSYGLTPGQRDILRDWYSLTPTRTIEVTNIELFDPAIYGYVNLVRSVTLRSNIHVEEHKRKHMLISCVIDNWGAFCTAAKRRDEERAQAKESAVKEDVLAEVTKPRNVKKSIEQLMSEYSV